MQPKTPKLLNDLRDSAAFILAAVSGKSFDHYHGDRVLRQAIERSFEIIGEAMKRLAQHDPETAARIGDYREIIAFRNVLIHGYDLVDHHRTRSADANPGHRRTQPPAGVRSLSLTVHPASQFWAHVCHRGRSVMGSTRYVTLDFSLG